MEKSFFGVLISNIFSLLGYLTHIVIVQNDSNMWIICVLAFIYAAPLLFEGIEDFIHISASNKYQFILDELAVAVGSIYLVLNLGLLVILTLTKQYRLDVAGWLYTAFKFCFAVLPSVFMFRNLFLLATKWKQVMNTATAYFRNQ